MTKPALDTANQKKSLLSFLVPRAVDPNRIMDLTEGSELIDDNRALSSCNITSDHAIPSCIKLPPSLSQRHSCTLQIMMAPCHG